MLSALSRIISDIQRESQRVTGIALGYEDLSDHDDLRRDPVLALVPGKLEARRKGCAPLAGKSTLSRLEHAPAGGRPSRYAKIDHDPEKPLYLRVFTRIGRDFGHREVSQAVIQIGCTAVGGSEAVGSSHDHLGLVVHALYGSAPVRVNSRRRRMRIASASNLCENRMGCLGLVRGRPTWCKTCSRASAFPRRYLGGWPHTTLTSASKVSKVTDLPLPSFPRHPPEISFGGRVLFLADDAELIRRQLHEGLDPELTPGLQAPAPRPDQRRRDHPRCTSASSTTRRSADSPTLRVRRRSAVDRDTPDCQLM